MEKLLKKTAFIGPLVCCLTVVLAWIGGINAVKDTAAIPLSCKHDGFERVVLPPPSELFSSTMLLGLAQVGSYGFYSFAVIVTVPTLRHQMKDATKTAPAAILAYVISVVCFVPIMLLGYGGFGNLVPENLIDGMRSNRPA